MARLAGVDIPRDKRVEVALTYIYGVGRTRALKTLADTEISGEIRVKDLTDDQLIALRDYIEGNYKVEGDLRREVAALTAEGKMSAIVLAILPPAIGMVMYVMNKSYMHSLFSTGLGHGMLIAAVVMMVDHVHIEISIAIATR